MYRFVFVLLILCSAVARSTTVAFEQHGWTEGGPLSVVFTGDDQDSDGFVTAPELTSFAATWRLPAGGSTAWSLHDFGDPGDPGDFLYAGLGDMLIFVRNSEYSLILAAFEGETTGSVFDQFLFPVATSASSAEPVPEPGSLGLLAAGLVCLAAATFRRGTGETTKSGPPASS